MLKAGFILIFAFLFQNTSQAASPAPKICQSAQELQKTYQYLVKQTDLNLNPQQILRLSLEVAAHCTGASERFQKVYQQLSKAGVAIKKTLEVATAFAKKTDQQVELFNESIRILFLERNYDLSFYEAFQWANTYAEAPQSQQKTIKEDLKYLIQFCLGENKETLSLSVCRELSLELLKIATQDHRGPVANDFKKLYGFLSSGSGPKYPLNQNLKIIVEVLKFGSNAAEQFIQSFQYASSKTGLSLGPEQSYQIAFRSAQSSQVAE